MRRETDVRMGGARRRAGGLRVVVAGACLAVAACSAGSDSSSGEAGSSAGGASDRPPEVVFPGDAWTEIAPTEAGFDPAALDEAATRAEEAGSNCLLVSRRGRIVGEWYWNGTDATSSQEVFSATKSYASALVGIAQAEGAVDIDDPASDYVTDWQGTASEDVTIRNLLSNDSGRFWSYQSDYQELIAAQDRDAYAVGLDQADEPGTTWNYNNAAIQTLDVVLAEATGEDPAQLAEDGLFMPLGMDDSEMTRDGAGNTMLFMGLQSTCRDMARFGHLFLNRGDWDGIDVLPEAWIDASVGQPSQELNVAYGLLWWLNRRGEVPDADQAVTAEADDAGSGEEDTADQMVPGAPEDMYWALGLGGQIIQVDPGSATVVVRLGPPANEGDYGNPDTAAVVTDAMTEP